MPQFRKRDNGDIVEAYIVKDATETASTPFYRELPVLDARGVPMRRHEGDHEVTVEKGQWLVRDGEHTYPYPDEYFDAMFIPVGDHEFVPNSELGRSHLTATTRDADEAVSDGKRYANDHGAYQEPERVQMHAAIVAALNGDREKAQAILDQKLPKQYPSDVDALMSRQGEFVDAATISFIEQSNELERLRRQVRRQGRGD